MLSTIIFLSSLILFLSLMLCIKISVNLDFGMNLLVIVIRIYGIKIVKIDIDIIGLYYRINKSKKLKSLKLLLPKEQEYLIKQIKSSILDKLYYDRIIFKSSIYCLDPYKTANTIGVLNTICNYINIAIYSKNNDTVFKYYNWGSFIEKENKISLDIKVYFTIFDMVFALIMSFYKRGQYVKQKK